ncbi:PP2C family protein-serine/threonine phosphatase [Sphaerisporangium perillae]|uniref:PP2C family protein-serine/threonine phosphatase n=1 Tax=Sphaerisporangium perillae TaxID=2935860 RepID=UPI00200E069E|nr:PP2C family protein-serine/threonine phosphatase [Sphaerisporangium perillae]
MKKTSVLVLDDGPEPPQDLRRALEEAGARVRVHTPADVLAAEPVPVVDVLLASAEVPPNIVRAVARRMDAQGLRPTVLAYTEHDFGALEGHVHSGSDYLMPPFLTSLVRARLGSCREQAELSRALSEAGGEADLLRYERELEIGREIQLGFLPESLPTPAGWGIDVRYRPARTVAGDFYDVFELVNRRRLGLVVADVCDKGVGAALFMALIRSLLRHTAEHGGIHSLKTVDMPARHDARTVPMVGAATLLNAVEATNDYLTRNHVHQGYFATMFFAVLDPVTGSLVYINGGHNPPVLVRAAGGTPSTLDPTGPAVGVIRDSTFTLGHAHLDPGDVLFIYTDGVTEARAPDREFFGEDRMLDVLCDGAGSGDDLLRRIDGALTGFVGTAEQSDDITMMAVHRTGA